MKRKLLLSILIGAVIFVSAVVGVVAATGTQQITALLNGNIKITLNGDPWTPRDATGKALTPITYEGSTYLPVRAVAEAAGMSVDWDGATQTVILSDQDQYDVLLEFPADRYPVAAAHIASAILSGATDICTIDRSRADANRSASLAGIPIMDGYDRDEWPMAMCDEGGSEVSVVYIDPSENRGAGSWVGNQLAQYPDGTRVKFVISFREMDAKAARNDKQQSEGEVYYRSCAEAREAGVAPLRIGDPGYGRHLDRDGDGIACE